MRMAGEKTRQILANSGVAPEVYNDPELTMKQANDILFVQVETAQHGSPPFRSGKFRCLPVSHFKERMDAVGESFYKFNLELLQAKYGMEDGWARCWAVLIPEPKNKHDRNAVAVYIDDQKVGHFSREDAEFHQQRFIEMERLGFRITCPAVIAGDQYIGVFLRTNEEQLKGVLAEALAQYVPPKPLFEINPDVVKKAVIYGGAAILGLFIIRVVLGLLGTGFKELSDFLKYGLDVL